MNLQMIYRRFFFVAMLLLVSNQVIAQPAQLTEPQYVGSVFWLDPAEGKLGALEHQQPSSQMKVRAMGYGGARAFLSFKGNSSPIRLSAEQQVFIVRLEANGLNPGLLVGLDVLKTTKKSRDMTTVSAGFMGIGAKTSAGESAIHLMFQKYGEHSFKITPAAMLPAGEYVIRTKATGQLGYLFGVD
jgi:hypothetical protein